ncbi:hypothetical protein GLYMA_14G118000v4 [Glycine max]|nr:hypothetical protein GLYMA_14G118000v4 [Glycine max]
MGKHSTQFSALNYIDLALDLDAIFFIGQKCLESPLQLCVCCSMKVNADLDMELNPQAQPWPYQPKSLNRMFRNVLLIFILWCARHRRLCDYGRKGSSTRSCIYHIKGLMSSRPEIGNKSNTQNNAENKGFAESHDNEFIPASFPVGPWDDFAIMSDNITGLKRFRDEDVKPFSGLNSPKSQVEYHWTKVRRTELKLVSE